MGCGKMWLLSIFLFCIGVAVEGLNAEAHAWKREGRLLTSSLRGFGGLSELSHHGSDLPPPLAKASLALSNTTGNQPPPEEATTSVSPKRRSPSEVIAEILHHLGGSIVFLAFGALVYLQFQIIKHERETFNQYFQGGNETFSAYLRYRFTDWFTTSEVAPSTTLIFLAISLIVIGALTYSIIIGEAPAHALWRIFVWASASPAENETSPGGRFLGICVTVCGMVILSLLFGIVSEVFATKTAEIKRGMLRVVEGGHTVILGWTDCTLCLIEELAKAKESGGGGTFVILAEQSKEELDEQMADDSIDLLGSRVIFRTGNPNYIRDLHKVSVQSASQIVIPADTNLAPEEADAKSLRTLLALKSRNWPSHGNIVVECASPPNRSLFEKTHKCHVVVVGSIVAKLIAQSTKQVGLASVFGMMLGFDGDEFYIQDREELIGSTFWQATFRSPDAVVMGVYTAAGKCLLNPGWGYRFQEGDQVIVLAEDDDAFAFPEERYFSNEDETSPKPSAARKQELREALMSTLKSSNKDTLATRTLLLGWNHHTPSLLSALDTMVAEESSVTIYSAQSVEEREVTLSRLSFHNLSVFEHKEVDLETYTSYAELANLDVDQFDKVIVQVEGHRECSADQRTIAALLQLKEIAAESESAQDFHPVVEVHEECTQGMLQICGFSNFVHSSSLISQALAAVSEDPKVNGIYAQLMSGEEHSFDLMHYSDILPGEEEPTSVSFAELTWTLASNGDMTLLAWSRENEDGLVEWEMNPADKVAKRDWTSRDMLAVLTRIQWPDDDVGASVSMARRPSRQRANPTPRRSSNSRTRLHHMLAEAQLHVDRSTSLTSGEAAT